MADLFSNVGGQTGAQAYTGVQTFDPARNVDERAVRQQRAEQGGQAEQQNQTVEAPQSVKPVSEEALSALGLDSVENNPQAKRGSFVDIVA